jgi:hypothetical protein
MLGSSAVAGNGSVLLRHACEGECPADLLAEVRVVDSETLAEIPGRIVLRGLNPEPLVMFVAWRADETLVAGRTYLVSDAAAPDVVREVFALPSGGSEIAPMLSAATSIVALGVGELGCCATWPGNCEPEYCIPSAFDKRPRLAVSWPQRDQLATWVTWSSSAGESVSRGPFWGNVFNHVFENESDSYCYELEFESLIDGERLGPFSDCVAHGDLGAIGVFELTPSELATELTFCSEPPTGYEGEWCAVFSEECAAMGSAGAASAGASSQEPEPAGAGGAVADDGTPERLVRTEGACLCGVAGGSHANSGWAYGALALLGVAGARRRRRAS